MKILISTIVGVIVICAILLIGGGVYIVPEAQQAIITQFGKPVGGAITKPGLHLKIPFIQERHSFDKRLLEWDGDPKEIPTRDKKFIWIDTTARWKIIDPLKFLQSVGNEMGALSKLDDIINSATRDAITGHLLDEVIRTSNRMLEEEEGNDITDRVVVDHEIEPINVGRVALEKMILDTANELTPQYGIVLVDVRIKKISYIESVKEKVYDRMIAERQRAAQMERSEGMGKKAEIDGNRDKELKFITSEAYRKAQGVMGKADAEATKIYADAYNKDPDYYNFKKTLDTYKKTIDDNTTLMLSTDNDYFMHLNTPDAKK